MVPSMVFPTPMSQPALWDESVRSTSMANISSDRLYDTNQRNQQPPDNRPNHNRGDRNQVQKHDFNRGQRKASANSRMRNAVSEFDLSKTQGRNDLQYGARPKEFGGRASVPNQNQTPSGPPGRGRPYRGNHVNRRVQRGTRGRGNRGRGGNTVGLKDIGGSSDESDLQSWVSEATTVADLTEFDNEIGGRGYHGGRGGRGRGRGNVRKYQNDFRNYDAPESNKHEPINPVIGTNQDPEPSKRRNKRPRKRGRGRGSTGCVNSRERINSTSSQMSGESCNLNETNDEKSGTLDCSSEEKKVADGKWNLDDLHTAETKALVNRLKRYKTKLQKFKKEGGDAKDIQERLKYIEAIQKEVNMRKESVKNNAEKGPFNEISESDEDITENIPVSTVSSRLKSTQPKSKSKKISFKPKAKNTGKAKPLLNKVKPDSSSPSDSDTIVPATNTKPSKQKPKPASKSGQKKVPVEKNDETGLNAKNPKENKKAGNRKSDSKPELTAIFSKFDNLFEDSSDFVEPMDRRQEEVPVQDPTANELIYRRQEKVPVEKCATNEDVANLEQKPNMDFSKEVFKFVVKTFEGKGKPDDVKKESGMFPVSCDAAKWFKVSKLFNTVERNGKVVAVLAFIKDISYCLDYIRASGCKDNDCSRFHVCKDMLCGKCFYGDRCRRSHDFLDERNVKIANKLGLSKSFTSEEIGFIMKVRFPHVCKPWIENGTCDDEEDCINLHLCPEYIYNKCEGGDGCPFGHDKLSSHNKPIVVAFHMQAWKDPLFRKMLYMQRTPKTQPGQSGPFESIEEDEKTGMWFGHCVI